MGLATAQVESEKFLMMIPAKTPPQHPKLQQI
jgi:hypothetical protein